MKLLNTDSMKDVDKAINRAVDECIEEGHIETLCSLVSKKVITVQQALEECGLTEKEFIEKMKEYGLDK